MYVIKIMVVLAILSCCISPTYAEAPAPPVRPLTAKELVTKYATIYKVSESQMKGTIACESGWDVNNHYQTSKEDSWGLVQINLLAHPTVTKEQAINPDFAIRFMAEHFSKKHQSMWTCWVKLYGNRP